MFPNFWLAFGLVLVAVNFVLTIYHARKGWIGTAIVGGIGTVFSVLGVMQQLQRMGIL